MNSFNRTTILSVLLAFLAAFVGITVIEAQEPSPPFNLDDVPPPEQAPMAVMGASLFQENCAPCHGSTGAGDGETAASLPNPPPAFNDPSVLWDQSPAEYFHVTKFGRMQQMMPPWRNRLSDDEIWLAVFYLWTLHTSEAQSDQGADLYAQACTACHGEGGAGDGPEAEGDVPNLTDLERMMALSQADLRQSWMDAHPEAGADWSDVEQRSVLDYIRTFTYRPPWAPLEEGPGVILGRVEQRTPSADGVTGGVVRLEVYAHMTPLDTLETEVQPEGTFEFSQLPVDPSLFYLAIYNYNGVEYTSGVVLFGQDQASTEGTQDLPENTVEAIVGIYETTNDASAIQISQANWIVEHQPGALLVGQVVAFSNSGDRTYVGETVAGIDVPVTAAVGLPPGIQEVGFQDGRLGETYQRLGDVVYDTRPILPGENGRQIFVRYFLPYEETVATVAQPILYQMDSLNVLVADLPDLEASVMAPQAEFVYAGEEEIQGMPYRRWSGSDLSPQEVTLDFSGLLAPGSVDPRMSAQDPVTGQPIASTAAVTPALDPVIPMTIGSVLLVVLAGVLVWRWRWGGVLNRSAQDDVPAITAADLMDQIARLDDLHALGEVDDARWQRRRAELKRHLLDLANREEGA